MATILRTRDGRLDAGDAAALDSLLRRIAEGSPNILLHLHGGLVDQAAAESMAARLSGSGDAAYNAPADWEQIYLVWRTGALETLRTNWTELANNDRLYRALLKRLITFASGKVRTGVAGRSLAADGGFTEAEVARRLSSGDDRPFGDVDDATMADPAASRAQVDETAEDDLALELERDVDLEDAAADIEAALAEERPGVARSTAGGDPVAGRAALHRLSRPVRAELEVDADAAATRSIFGTEVFRRVIVHGVAIGTRVLRRYRSGRDHGLHATVVEEIARELYGDLIGSVVWGMMKGDASEHFGPEALGHRLISAVAANPDARLLIVAHSAGSILATDMLLWAAREDLPLQADVVFLAPAVRTRKFAEALERSNGAIARFRSFAMHDDLERRDVLLGRGLGFIYPSSLLYLVSGLFEEEAAEGLADAPLLGMQRFVAGDSPWLDDPEEGPPLRRVREFLSEQPNRTVFAKVSGGDGLSCDAVSHGGFDDETATLRSVIHFLGEGRG